MALYTFHHDAPRVVAAARQWVDRCLIEDRSALADEPVGTPENFEALDRYFVKRPDEGSGSFYEKLAGQLADAPPAARKLMAELIWALFLFPSNISPGTKREGIRHVWAQSGDQLPGDHPLLSDATLDGIGSAGMGVNTNRWRELNYMIGLGQATKRLSQAERRAVTGDYDRFMAWMDTVPQEGDRQFRHMLRYFLFPERVERMSSNNDRVRVLAGFGIARSKDAKKWTDRELDDALYDLRQRLEQEHDTTKLDFYVDPLRKRWKESGGNAGGPEDENEIGDGDGEVKEPPGAYEVEAPRNLILYGPPGTGKTWQLQQLFRQYTDQPADVDRPTWEQQLVGKYGWRAVIAATLADLTRPARVADIAAHPLVRAKARQLKRSTRVETTLWGYLQSHSSLDSPTVKVADRRPPHMFDKTADATWFLLPDWRELDGDAAQLSQDWRGGPSGEEDEVRRYRVVTFHPSYSYEDFVIGLRPVVEADDGATGFRLVDGVFKQICAEARANPRRRYALFIDEINRGNIAKVFGELITLIEPDKRARYDAQGRLTAGLEVQLPGTGGGNSDDEHFGVPANLDIYGTMNTADRSIALLDIALRRRFDFQEVGPDYRVIDRSVEGIHLGRLLAAINERLEFLADRDRRIGHAYLTGVTSIADLRDTFERKVIPLLQEYFFDDWSRVALVLATDGDRSAFIDVDELDGRRLWQKSWEGRDEQRLSFLPTPTVQWDADAFRAIYAGFE